MLQFIKKVTLSFTGIGFFLGFIYAIGGLTFDLLVHYGYINSTATTGLSLGTMVSFGAMLVLPLIFTFIGLVVGIVSSTFLSKG